MLSALPEKGCGGYDDVYAVEGEVIILKPQAGGAVSMKVRVGEKEAWVWLSKEQAAALGIGLVVGCRVGVEGASYYVSESGYPKLGLTPLKDSGRAPATVKLLEETTVSPLSMLVETTVSRSAEHYIMGFVGGKVVDKKREYLLLWNKKTADHEMKAVAVVSYFTFPRAQVGAVVTCGPVVALEAGKDRVVRGFKTAVHVPEVAIRPSAAAFVRFHDSAYLAPEAAQSVVAYVVAWADALAPVEAVVDEQAAAVEVDVELLL